MNFIRAVLALALALSLALAAAAVIWLWWRSPVPTFRLFTPLLHGMLLGVALVGLAQWLQIRSRAGRIGLALLAGLVSALALAAAQYVDDACAHRQQKQRVASAFAELPSGISAIVTDYERDVLVPATGHRGLVGHWALEHRGSPWLMALSGFEAIVVVVIPAALVGVRRDGPAESVN